MRSSGSDDTVPTASIAAGRAVQVLVACSGLLGCSGVLVGAAVAHGGGGEVARTAAEYLLVHAAAVLGGCGVVRARPRPPRMMVGALALIVVGATLFGGELALSSLAGVRALAWAAPTGGLCLIVGWLGVIGAGVVSVAA